MVPATCSQGIHCVKNELSPLPHLGETSSPHIGRLDRVAHVGFAPCLGQAVRPAVSVAYRVAGACISGLHRAGGNTLAFGRHPQLGHHLHCFAFQELNKALPSV